MAHAGTCVVAVRCDRKGRGDLHNGRRKPVHCMRNETVREYCVLTLSGFCLLVVVFMGGRKEHGRLYERLANMPMAAGGKRNRMSIIACVGKK